jgi:hypothetical protein
VRKEGAKMFDLGYFMGLRDANFSDIVLAAGIGWVVIMTISFLVYKALKPEQLTFEQILKTKIGEKKWDSLVIRQPCTDQNAVSVSKEKQMKIHTPQTLET